MNPKPKVCIVVATPLTIHFFFRRHIIKMSDWADISIIYNSELNTHVDLDDLPSRNISVKIMRKISLMYDVLAFFDLWRQFRKHQFDMVISLVPKAGLLGITAAFLSGVPVRLHIFQGEVWATTTGMMRKILKAADWITALFSTDLMAVSASERSFLEREIGSINGRIKVLGSGSICGVDLAKFKPDNRARKRQRKDLGIPENAVVAIFLGRLTCDKGVFLLVEAYRMVAAEFNNFYLVIAGPDEDEVAHHLIASVGELARDRLIVSGFTERPWTLFNTADFLCLLSKREGFGMVAIEAGAFGIPSIGTKIYGLEDSIIDGKTGMLVSVDDVSETVDALRTLIGDVELRKVLGENARKRVIAEFEQEKIVDAYNAEFAKIFSERVSRSSRSDLI
jgi:glycosyltransferase involved in cell wall biosynthesis